MTTAPNAWFHYNCVGLSEQVVTNMECYKCQKCTVQGVEERIYEEGLHDLNIFVVIY